MINYCSGYCYCLNILPTSWFSVVRSLIIHPPSFYSGASLQGTSWGRVLCPLYSGASLQVTSWGRVLCPLYSGASLQGTSWGRVLCPLYSGASLQVTSWGRVLCPLYSGASLQGTSWGQVLCPLYSGASLQGTSWGTGPLSLIQWSLSTRDKLGTGLIQWSLSTRGRVLCPLYSGASLQGTGPLSLVVRLSSSPPHTVIIREEEKNPELMNVVITFHPHNLRDCIRGNGQAYLRTYVLKFSQLLWCLDDHSLVLSACTYGDRWELESIDCVFSRVVP